MSGKLNANVDRTIVKEALSYIRGFDEREEMVMDFLKELLLVLHAVSEDQEVEGAKHYAGVSRAKRREQLRGVIRKIEEVTDTLEFFRAPMLRYEKDGQVPPTRPIGLSELRDEMVNQLTAVISNDYIERFGTKPIQYDKNDVSLGPINTRNRAFAIATSAEDILIDLLNLIAIVIRETEKQIAGNTPAGGPRVSKIREILLLNLVALWVQINDGKLSPNYSGGRTKFFNFCSTLSRAIGVRALCTETHLATAVKIFNEKITKNPTPERP